MKLEIAFNHLEPTPSIKSKIEDKAEKLKKYFHGDLHVTWTCSVNKDRHISHVTIFGDKIDIHAESTQDNLYKTFDDVIHKLEKQLVKLKSKNTHHIH